mmetsp:Transcript_76831/g.115621  ORF Transcript_76831/g.115621 Transcript_76831/m.115621 type:complete len:288 (-) Transcript_76831:57-920(-)
MSLSLGDYDIDLTVYGSGAQAKVVCGKHVVTKEVVAIKVFSLKTQSNLLCFENEARLLKLCQKIENVVDAKSCFVHKQFGFLVMPFFKKDLLAYVMDNSGLEESFVAPVFKQICAGIQQCHEIGIAHLDIKPENILFDEVSKKAYLCDFGNSHRFDGKEKVNIGRRGTLVYCAPEVKLENNPYDPIAADIWSLGILLHVIIAGYFPHSKGEKDMELYHQGYVNLNFIRALVSPSCFDLLSKILTIEPESRLSVCEIIMHPWVQEHTKPPKASIASKLTKRFRGKSSS